MGLDISYYSEAKLVTDPSVDIEDAYLSNDSALIHAYTLKGMSQSLRGLEEGKLYHATYRGGFRAGSYRGYNVWRNRLCQLALGIPVITLWESTEYYSDSPFYELINFADNEGTIGPEAAVDLYIDFCTEQEKIEAQLGKNDDDAFFLEKYLEWKEAFRVASTEHGIVQFH
jgi:hypothetical protein